jgi:glutamine synthetase
MSRTKSLPKYLEEAKLNLDSDDPAKAELGNIVLNEYLKSNREAYLEYKDVINDSEKVAMLNDNVQKVLRDIVDEYEEIEKLIE